MKRIKKCSVLLILMNFFCSLTYAIHPIERFTTDNGLPVTYYYAPEVPMVVISLAFKAGSAYDGKQYGLSQLTMDMLDEGSGNFSATQFARKMANTGAQLQSSDGKDMTVFSLKSLTEPVALHQATELFSLMIGKPKFDEPDLIRVKNQQVASIKQLSESPDELANKMFFKALYAHHPYGHSTLGNTKKITETTLADVKDFYGKYYTIKNGTLVIVGAVSKNEAKDIANLIAKGLPLGTNIQALPEPTALTKSESIHQKFPSSQTNARIGQLGIRHNNPDYFPLYVGNHILGGGSLVSILSTEVREKNGLTYGIYSQFVPMDSEGPFLITLATKNDQREKAVKLTHDVLKRFISEGPTKEELADAKSYLIGSFPVSFSTNSQIADILLRMAFYHLPNDYLDTYTTRIKNVTQKDIQKAFMHIIHPDKLIEVTIGGDA